MTATSFACHYSYLTLNSGPTDIGGGLYSTDVTVCIGQKQNWGGTSNFTLCFDIPISSASGANFPTVTNTYNICGGPCGPTQSVTATATGTISGNCITYTTTSSTPAGYPLVPDRYDGGAGAAGNTNSFCFTITIVTTGYPSSLALAGNVESDPGISGDDGNNAPCQGNGYEPDMTITFPGNPLPIELISFTGYNKNGINTLSWTTLSEVNNDYFLIEASQDAMRWQVVTEISGAGNSSQLINYIHHEINFKDTFNYYRLTQFDFNGMSKSFDLVSIDNRIEPKIIDKRYNIMGQELTDDTYIYYTGLVIELYKNGSSMKFMKHSDF
jgi:hypothetical protein